ncbi:MAG: serine hydrolase domain-containing protein [Rikenellaceae bacterium]
MRRIYLIIIVCLSVLGQSKAQNRSFECVDNYIKTAIDSCFFPGAQLIVGNSKGVVYTKNYGYLDYSQSIPVSDSTIYDLASCTKVLATTLAVMTLVDQNKIDLEAKVGDLIEGADTMTYADVKVENLLYHESGFAPVVPVLYSLVESAYDTIPLLSRKKSVTNPIPFDGTYYAAKDVKYKSIYVGGDYEGIRLSKNQYINRNIYSHTMDSMINAAYDPNRLGKCRYSDLNFYLLKEVVERISNMSIENLLGGIYERMNVRDLGYKPLNWSDINRIAPTEYDPLLRRDTVRGVVHDEMSYVVGGVSGAAGLFGTAHDVAKICAMFLRGGVDYEGHRIVSKSTLDKFTTTKRFSSGAVRGLGFDKLNPNKSPYTEKSFGHTGFTGTYFWIAPDKDMYVVLLTNRVHPTRANRKLNSEWRGKMWQMCDSLRMVR